MLILYFNYINAMIVNKYHKCIFYAHNLSNYDVPFILKTLLDSNHFEDYGIFYMDTIFHDARIIYLIICKQIFSSV